MSIFDNHSAKNVVLRNSCKKIHNFCMFAKTEKQTRKKMKYFIRSVKYFFYYILILIVIMAVLVAAGLVEPDPATMFRNGFKSVGQILLLFAVVAAIYPKVGFCKRKAVVEGEFEDLKDGIKIIMEDRGYRLESENGEKMTFRLASKINAVARMLEDRVTVCAVPDGLEVEGITKDVIRIISNLEYRLRNDNE